MEFEQFKSQCLNPLGSDFLKHCTKIKLLFLKRCYPENVIAEEIKKVKFSEIGSKKPNGSKRVPFMVTYHPSSNCHSCIIRDYLNILCMSWE